MAKQWKGKCLQCGQNISYADELATRDAASGKPRPTTCPNCLSLEARGLRATPMSEIQLDSTEALGPSPLGELGLKTNSHQLDERPSGLKREKFAVQDKEINELYHALADERTPVIIAVAPTGSGKSTFCPTDYSCQTDCRTTPSAAAARS